MDIKGTFVSVKNFLKEDSWPSFIVSLILALIIIKFIFFPLLSLATGTELPLVIVESCSMYHSQSLEQIMENKYYSDYGLNYEDTSDWNLKNGFTKGDIIFVVGVDEPKIGDVIIFDAGQSNPIIHRVIGISDSKVFTTKGDNNAGLLVFEKSILKEQIMGRAVFKVPFIGWIKLIFFDWMKSDGQRGFC